MTSLFRKVNNGMKAKVIYMGSKEKDDVTCHVYTNVPTPISVSRDNWIFYFSIK